MLRALIIWPAAALLTAVFGFLSVLGSLCCSGSRFGHWCMRRWAAAILRLAGVKLLLEGAERIPRPPRSLVLVCNHQGMADILALAALLPFRFAFVAKSELFHIPFLGWHMRRNGFIPIHRGRPEKNIEPLSQAEQALAAGRNILFFPEGTRSPDGQIQRFHRGAFELARRGASPILPLAIRGSRQILPKGSWRVCPGTVAVRIAAPVDPHSVSGDASALAQAVRQIVLANSQNN